MMSGEKIESTFKTSFNGFEIWKDENCLFIKDDMEKRLKGRGINYSVYDDENGLLFLEIN